MTALNTIKDNPGSRYVNKRIGRGIGSGKGKTSGSGHKGQKARSGVSLLGFEGGQNPIYRRLPKRGFTNIFRREVSIVNLIDLQRAIDAGKLGKGQTVDVATLVNIGLINSDVHPVKLLGNGQLKVGLDIHVHKVSKSCADAITKAGGKLSMIKIREPKPVGKKALQQQADMKKSK